MNDATVRGITAWSGVLVGGATTLVLPLYLVNAGAPSTWNVLTRTLLNLLLCALLLVFLTGLRHLVYRAGAAHEWCAMLAYGAGLLYVAVTLIARALEAGAIFGAPDGSIDPTVDGPLAAASVLLHGSIGRLLTFVTLAAAGYGLQRSQLLPGWAWWTAYAIAVINLAFVPSLYFGVDAARFYSAVVWGNTAFVASFMLYWSTAVGIGLLRQPRPSVVHTEVVGSRPR